jgi:ribosomal protein S20
MSLYNETAIKEMLKVANKMIEDYKYNRYKSACLAKVAMDYLKKFFDAIRANDIDNARKYLEKATHVWHMAV